ncbi:hypothetical protein RF11_03191 [Thelohanellus kitauei]|uniref:Uncharacterized protein n=1 Tax=Thelohanellus kitauei TaxID=669202 RepID=A0A0C2INJ4_THEKT|nr:hypothetical protein RF11_03191 [Thelohanellus kitauei]
MLFVKFGVAKDLIMGQALTKRFYSVKPFSRGDNRGYMSNKESKVSSYSPEYDYATYEARIKARIMKKDRRDSSRMYHSECGYFLTFSKISLKKQLINIKMHLNLLKMIIIYENYYFFNFSMLVSLQRFNYQLA